ncbi:MAG: hypothetical protein WCI17_12155 [bacterium]
MPVPSILLAPVPFSEAIADRAVRSLLPTSLSSSDLMKLSPEIRRRAVFSARVTDATHLSTLDRLIGQIITPSGVPGEYMNEPRARELLRAHLDETGWQPAEGEAGRITDLRSTQRVRLQLNMGVGLANGYGQAVLSNDPDVLDSFPGWRFLPSFADDPRPDSYWLGRWQSAGLPGPFGSDYVALKGDPGWSRLSVFGTPYPPFAWNSMRQVEDVERSTCESYGLLQPGSTPPAIPLQDRRPLTASIPEPAPDLLSAILDAFSAAKFTNGILSALS